jgi:hypothetical protein
MNIECFEINVICLKDYPGILVKILEKPRMHSAEIGTGYLLNTGLERYCY